MFLHGYFYWSGVVVNCLIVFWLIIGACFVVKNWMAEKKFREKYVTKTLNSVTKTNGKNE